MLFGSSVDPTFTKAKKREEAGDPTNIQGKGLHMMLETEY